MEFVETPTFWCPHVDRTACTNFSPRTVELRPFESREIFPFPSPFLIFLFPFSMNYFSFFSLCFLSSFPSFLSFLLFFSFSHFSSHFPFHFLFSFGISLPFGWSLTVWVKRRKFPSHFLKPNVWLSNFHLYSYFFISFL